MRDNLKLRYHDDIEKGGWPVCTDGEDSHTYVTMGVKDGSIEEFCMHCGHGYLRKLPKPCQEGEHCLCGAKFCCWCREDTKEEVKKDE